MIAAVKDKHSTELAAVLVKIAQERGYGVERLRAEKLIRETCHAWSGDAQQLWGKWLAESASSLGLRARIGRFSVNQALELVEDGALLICNPDQIDTVAILLGSDGQNVDVACTNSEWNRKISYSEVSELVAPSVDSNRELPAKHPLWVIVEDLEVTHEPTERFHGRPVARLIALLKPEWSDIWVVGVFAFFAGLLSLATPIAVESLVNTVAFGRLLQPLVILSLMLFGFLAFASMMRALQTFVVEIIQRRLFARVAADLAYRFPRIRNDALGEHYGPELANRFFDVVTLQKVVAQLLLDGIAILLATAVGMAVLAFYHPWLLGFDILLLLLVVTGVFFLGRGAIASGIDESKQKYRLASWFEDIMRCPISFKTSGAAEFAIDRANQITADYLASRGKHFRVLFRQLLFIFGLQTLAGTVLLGFGGWLVISGQLTLGQLVAAELIVATILGSLAKLGKHIEGFYDVIASVDKLGYLLDLQMEPQEGILMLQANQGARLQLTEVDCQPKSSRGKRRFSLQVDPGETLALQSSEAAGSTKLFDFLFGLAAPKSGHIEIENADPRDLRPDILREFVSLVRGEEIFDGTIAENIHLARSNVRMTDVREALQAVGLLDFVLRLPNGLQTKLNPSGYPLSKTQISLIVLARAISAKPRLLLVDGVLDSLGNAQLDYVCNTLRQGTDHWTLLVATNRGEVAEQFARIVEVE